LGITRRGFQSRAGGVWPGDVLLRGRAAPMGRLCCRGDYHRGRRCGNVRVPQQRILLLHVLRCRLLVWSIGTSGCVYGSGGARGRDFFHISLSLSLAPGTLFSRAGGNTSCSFLEDGVWRWCASIVNFSTWTHLLGFCRVLSGGGCVCGLGVNVGPQGHDRWAARSVLPAVPPGQQPVHRLQGAGVYSYTDQKVTWGLSSGQRIPPS